MLQGEPEFDRLKRELEEVKNAPRGLEGTFRSAAEMERHRAAAADAAIEEQLEVQTSFRQHGARLQVRKRCSLCMLRHMAALRNVCNGPQPVVLREHHRTRPCPTDDMSMRCSAGQQRC